MTSNHFKYLIGTGGYIVRGFERLLKINLNLYNTHFVCNSKLQLIKSKGFEAAPLRLDKITLIWDGYVLHMDNVIILVYNCAVQMFLKITFQNNKFANNDSLLNNHIQVYEVNNMAIYNTQ